MVRRGWMGLLVSAGLLWGCAHDPAPDATPAAQPRTYLWEVRPAEGGAPVAWLLGSVHVAREDSRIDAVLLQGFHEADTLAVEVDVEALQVREVRAAFDQAPAAKGQKPLSEALGPKDYARLTDLLSRLKLPVPDLDHKPPWLVSQMIALAAPLGTGTSGGARAIGIDQYFLRLSRGKKPIVALETLQQQVEVLSARPFAFQVRDLRHTIAAVERGQSPLASTVDAYFDGTLDEALQAAEKKAEQDGDGAYYREVFTKRNHTMADSIERLLRNQKRPFVVVGAGHLLGDTGVPALLSQRGFVVSEVPPSGTLIPVAIPDPSAPPLPAVVVLKRHVPWPIEPTTQTVKVRGVTAELHVAVHEGVRYVHVDEHMPPNRVPTLAQLYEGALLEYEGQFGGKLVRQESLLLGDLKAQFAVFESPQAWVAAVVVWADHTLTNFAGVAPADASPAVRADIEKRVKALRFDTVSEATVAAQTDEILEKIRARPDWLFPFPACPAALAKTATTPPRLKTLPCRVPGPCFDKCVAGDAWLCMELGDEFGSHGAAFEDIEPLYARSCRLGFAEGCDSQVAHAFRDDKNPAGWACAVETFAHTCEHGEPYACLDRGLAFVHGRGVEASPEEASHLLTRTCELMDGQHPACGHAKAAWRNLDLPGPEPMSSRERDALPTPERMVGSWKQRVGDDEQGETWHLQPDGRLRINSARTFMGVWRLEARQIHLAIDVDGNERGVSYTLALQDQGAALAATDKNGGALYYDKLPGALPTWDRRATWTDHSFSGLHVRVPEGWSANHHPEDETRTQTLAVFSPDEAKALFIISDSEEDEDATGIDPDDDAFRELLVASVGEGFGLSADDLRRAPTNDFFGAAAKAVYVADLSGVKDALTIARLDDHHGFSGLVIAFVARDALGDLPPIVDSLSRR